MRPGLLQVTQARRRHAVWRPEHVGCAGGLGGVGEKGLGHQAAQEEVLSAHKRALPPPCAPEVVQRLP